MECQVRCQNANLQCRLVLKHHRKISDRSRIEIQQDHLSLIILIEVLIDQQITWRDHIIKEHFSIKYIYLQILHLKLLKSEIIHCRIFQKHQVTRLREIVEDLIWWDLTQEHKVLMLIRHNEILCHFVALKTTEMIKIYQTKLILLRITITMLRGTFIRMDLRLFRLKPSVRQLSLVKNF